MSQPTWEQQAVESDTFKADDDDTTEIPKWEVELLTHTPPPKPMRIRYMELPLEHDGGEVRNSFIIVIDRMGDEWLEGSSLTELMGDALIEATGARGAVKFPGEVQIGDD